METNPDKARKLLDFAETRCYWALLDGTLRVRYLDPAARAHLGEQAAQFLNASLYDYIHPEELEAAKRDYMTFLESRTLFGTVTRCRYMRISSARKMYGATNDIPIDPPLERPDADEDYVHLKIVSSWIGEGTILCFFHTILDKDPAADSNEEVPSSWTNWCGPKAGDPTEVYLDQEEQGRIHRVMTATEAEAHQLVRQHAEASGQDYPEPQGMPRYVFQILTSRDASLILSHPLPQMNPDSHLVSYDSLEYARLAREVWEKPREKNTDAKTSCTRRYRSKHPIMRDGSLTTIDSVVIRYSSLCFACFQTRNTISSNRDNAPLPDYAYHTALPPFDPSGFPAMNVFGKRRRSLSDDMLAHGSVQHTRPAPLSLAASVGPGVRPFYDSDRFSDAISPTVASGAAILGSFSSYRPPFGSPAHSYSTNNTPQMTSPEFSHHSLDPNLHPNYSYMNGMNQNMDRPMTAVSNNSFSGDGLPSFLAYHASPTFSEYEPQPTPFSPSSANGHSATSSLAGAAPSKQPQPANPPVSSRTAARSLQKSQGAAVANPSGKSCESCHITNSPEWRKGPSGTKSLCNACGLRYARSQSKKAKKAAIEQALAEGRPLPPEPLKKSKSKKGKKSDKEVAAFDEEPSPFNGTPDYAMSTHPDLELPIEAPNISNFDYNPDFSVFDPALTSLGHNSSQQTAW